MRRAYVDHQKKLLVLWSPKSACTAVAIWFAFGLLGVSQAALRKSGLDMRDFLIEKGHHLADQMIIPYLDTTSSLGADYHVVAFTREPFARALSCYVNQFVHYYGRRLTAFDDLRGFAQHFYCEVHGVDTAEARASYRGLSFHEFLEHIEARVASRGTREPRLNIHFNTQVPFSLADTGVHVDTVYDVAHSDAAFAELNRRYGGSFIPGRPNSSPHGSSEGDPVSELSSVELASLPELPDRARFRTDHAVAVTQRAFAIDYDFLCYPLCGH